ncbi:hypothetical protein [Nonomuraea sp. B19D2]|uniref:hypothetical protein n=1 Tax=Nonomuraea sp. B19D2 TaxID=3159561 RepID=UPI0032DA77CE
MAERSYPFDGGQGAILSETDWEGMASLWQDDGVAGIPSGTDLKVTSLEVPGELKVAPGRAAFRGFHYQLDAELTLAYTLNADASQWRADVVVLRLDRGTNKISLAVKEGIPGGSAPTVDTNGVNPEMRIATYNVPPASGAVPAAQVLDYRPFTSMRIRVVKDSASSNFPDGTIFFDANAGRFYQKIKPSGASTSEQAPIPKFRETLVYMSADSNDYPTITAGGLAWDEAEKQLLIQTSSTSGTPTWTPVSVGGSTVVRRQGNLTVASGATTTDTALTVPVDRGPYQFEAVIFYRHAAASGTASVRLDHPSLGTGGTIGTGFDYLTTAGARTLSVSTATVPSQSIGAQTSGTNYVVRVFGSFVNSLGSAGNVSISYVNPNGTLTVLPGSYLSVTKA